jgi:hypothetical protein
VTELAPEEFSPEFAAWLAAADGTISVDPQRWPGAFVSLLNGELVYVFDRDDDGWISVSLSNRGGDAKLRFRTPSLDVVEHFLANEAGTTARFRAGLPDDIRVPFELEELPPSAVLTTLSEGPFGGIERLTVDGTVIGDFGYVLKGKLAHAAAVRAAYYGPASLAAIEASYLSPDGSPLFGIRQP